MAFETLLGGNLESLLSDPKLLILLIVVMIWKLTWYSIALWDTIEKKKKNLFVIFLVLMFVLNDLGIVPIVYLLIEKNKIKKK
jgi:hypothetical protein